MSDRSASCQTPDEIAFSVAHVLPSVTSSVNVPPVAPNEEESDAAAATLANGPWTSGASDHAEECRRRIFHPIHGRLPFLSWAACLLIGLGSLLAAYHAVSNSSQPRPSPHSTEPAAGRGWDDVDSRRRHIQAMAENVSVPASLLDEHSSQSKAIAWLVHEDTVITSPSDPNLVQRYALAVLAFATNSKQWSMRQSWEAAPNNHECTFEGVTCTGGLEATAIELRQRRMAGTLPYEIGLLTSLRTIVIGMNPLEGTLPSTLFELSNLEVLDIRQTELSSTISERIGKLSNLKVLDVSQTLLKGRFPNSMKQLTSLELVRMASTFDLSGSIFDFILSWPNLVHFQASGAMFTGSVSSRIASLSSLEVFALLDALISGTIPSEVGLLASLTHGCLSFPCVERISEEFAVSSSYISGSIPTEIGSATDLATVAIQGGSMSGPIPSEIGGLVGLKILHIPASDVTGQLPTEIGLLTELESIRLEVNRLEGSIPREFRSLTDLVLLDVSKNDLTGSVPAALCTERISIAHDCELLCPCCRSPCMD